MKIVIDKQEYEVEIEVFRRLVRTAQFALNDLQKKEGKSFPRVDKKALDLTFKLQLNHRELL